MSFPAIRGASFARMAYKEEAMPPFMVSVFSFDFLFRGARS